MRVWDAPEGRGPYGITATPDGTIYYASLAGDHIARIDTQTGRAEVIEPPTPKQGARRVWSDSSGRIWVSEWIAGQVSVYDPKTATWRSWRLPGERPQAYAVYVDEKDRVWLSDFGANAVVLFEPGKEHFEVFSERPARTRMFARFWAGQVRYGRRNREPINSSSTAPGHDSRFSDAAGVGPPAASSTVCCGSPCWRRTSRRHPRRKTAEGRATDGANGTMPSGWKEQRHFTNTCWSQGSSASV